MIGCVANKITRCEHDENAYYCHRRLCLGCGRGRCGWGIATVKAQSSTPPPLAPQGLIVATGPIRARRPWPGRRFPAFRPIALAGCLMTTTKHMRDTWSERFAYSDVTAHFRIYANRLDLGGEILLHRRAKSRRGRCLVLLGRADFEQRQTIVPDRNGAHAATHTDANARADAHTTTYAHGHRRLRCRQRWPDRNFQLGPAKCHSRRPRWRRRVASPWLRSCFS